MLDAMGGGLKSEDADEAERQSGIITRPIGLGESVAAAAAAAAAAALTSSSSDSTTTAAEGATGSGNGSGSVVLPGGRGTLYRTTHMFSATFPPEVQKMAKKYLRAPATVQIGDQDSGKNKRIAQEIFFLGGEAKKRSKLVEVLSRCPRPVIVFHNAKKQVRCVCACVPCVHSTCTCCVPQSDDGGACVPVSRAREYQPWCFSMHINVCALQLWAFSFMYHLSKWNFPLLLRLCNAMPCANLYT